MNNKYLLSQAVILKDIAKTLRFLSDAGCNGFECVDKSLQTIHQWGFCQFNTKQKNINIENVSVTNEPSFIKDDSLDTIMLDLGDCRRCKLCETRHHIMFGSGNPKAKLMFVGEAPGFDEDKTGKSLAGEAGELLIKIIQAIKLTLDQVYISNIVKCRPPNNRSPFPGEINTCMTFLIRQVEVIKPDFICTMGTVPSQTLLNSNAPISKLRGHFHNYQGIRLIPTYHPAYLLQYPDKKRETWEDMKMLMQEIQL